MKVDITTALRMRRKGPPRGAGNHDHPAWKANQFPKGKSGNPGGKPKVIQRFATMYVEQLVQSADNKVTKALGLKRGSSNFECLIKGMLNAAVRGDVAAAREIREVLEGKTITPIVSATIHAELENRGALAQAAESLMAEMGIGSDEALAPPTLDAAPPAELPPVPAKPTAQPRKARKQSARKA